MLTLVAYLVVLLAVPGHTDNVELTSNKERQFTCSGDQVIFTCRVFMSISLEWGSLLIAQPVTYRTFNMPPEILNRGPFTASLISISGTPLNSTFTSTLQVNASRMIMRNETTVTCLSSTMESGTDNFTVAETPTVPLNVAVIRAERAPVGGHITVSITWMRPRNIHQFDIDRYVISVISTSGAQQITTACGQCTNTVITVSENPNNVQMNTTLTATIAAVNQCGETGTTATASYTLINCGDPTPPRNGSIDRYHNTTDGAVILFGCNSMFFPSTRMTATCASNGMWTPDPAGLICTFDCGPPVASQHGSLESYTNTTEGSEVFYRCDQGLVPEGRMRAVCTRNGWSPNPAELCCTVASDVVCEEPTQLASGVTVLQPHNTTVSSVIVYQCQQPGFTPSQPSSVCGEDGRWSPDPSQVVCVMLSPTPFMPTTDKSLSTAAVIAITAVVCLLVAFITGALFGALVTVCIIRWNKKGRSSKPAPNTQEQQQAVPEYEEVQSQKIELKGNVAYVPVKPTQ